MTNQSDFHQPIHRPIIAVQHRDSEFDEDGFKTLHDMQERHFWYRGRHRFLLEAVDRHIPQSTESLSAIDLGGGVGGWVAYLSKHRPTLFSPLALADSSMVALNRP